MKRELKPEMLCYLVQCRLQENNGKVVQLIEQAIPGLIYKLDEPRQFTPKACYVGPFWYAKGFDIVSSDCLGRKFKSNFCLATGSNLIPILPPEEELETEKEKEFEDG